MPTEGATERIATILWRRLDVPGHESACLESLQDGWSITGVAVFGHDGEGCCLRYRVTCDRAWLTRSARVVGWIGTSSVALQVEATPDRRWRLNGEEVASVRGCTDLDLAFSPSTNLLPVRRLGLAVGQAEPVRAAWLRFPDLQLEPLDQVYRRSAADTFDYESGGGVFRASLKVDRHGFVVDYPTLWRREDAQPRTTPAPATP